MVLPIALALMGGGVYRKIRQDKQDEEDAATDRAAKADDRAYQRDVRDRTRKQWAEDDALKTSMKDAAAPRAVEDGTVYQTPNDDEGNAMPANGTEGTFKVGGQRFTDRAAADTAVVEGNKPGAAMGRMVDVLNRAGKPVEAMELDTKGNQSKVAKLQLDEAQRVALNRAYDDDLNKRGSSFEALAEFVSNSAGDGRAGSLKVKAVPSADGKKVVFAKVNDDGTTTPTAYSFDNTPQGLERAKSLLSRSVSPEAKLTHLHQQAQLQLQQDQLTETTRHNKATESNAADLTAARMEIAAMKLDAAKKAGAPGVMTMADLKDGFKTIASTLNADYKAQIDAEPDSMKAKAIKTARESEIAMVQRVFAGAASAGIAMTPEQAIAALRTGKISDVRVPKKDGSGDVTVKALVNGSRIIPILEEPGFPTAPGVAPGASPPAAGAAGEPAAAAVPAGASGAPQAAPTQQPAASMVETVNDNRVGLSDDPRSEAVKKNLRNRVVEAARGGRALTYAEELRAKQAGLI